MVFLAGSFSVSAAMEEAEAEAEEEEDEKDRCRILHRLATVCIADAGRGFPPA
jgi:hypothetical protein